MGQESTDQSVCLHYRSAKHLGVFDLKTVFPHTKLFNAHFHCHDKDEKNINTKLSSVTDIEREITKIPGSPSALFIWL